MSTKHAAGPWVVKRSLSKNAFNVIGIVPGSKYKIAQCPFVPDSLDEDEAEANAKLIASAPKLLEALKKIRNYFGENDKTVAEHKMFAIADEAIKKATE